MKEELRVKGEKREEVPKSSDSASQGSKPSADPPTPTHTHLTEGSAQLQSKPQGRYTKQQTTN